MRSTGMIIDGVFASQAIDSSGEILDIEGCDITTLAVDGVANYEHKSPDDKEEGGNNGEEIVGKIIHARKIFSAKDCNTDRERMYWDQVKVPYIYGMVRLYDGAGHSGAQALAAQIRDHHANGDPILVRFSIEGSTLDRDKANRNRLTLSVARRVALTLKPCNRTCSSGLIEDPRAPEGFDKQPAKEEAKDILAGLVEKKESTLAHPAYTRLGGAVELECSPLLTDEVVEKIKLIAKAKMLKALTAGSYAGVAPGALEGGSALQREDRGLRSRIRQVITDYKAKPFRKEEFRAFAKANLPEADDGFLDHFTDVAHDYHARRLTKAAPKSWLKPKVAAKPAVKPAKPKEKKAPIAAVKQPDSQYPAPHEGLPIRGDGPRPPENLTIRGVPAKPPEHPDVYFDEDNGVLHMPPRAGAWQKKTDKDTKEKYQEWNPGHNGGQFPMYIPGRDDPEHAASFNHLLNHDKDVNEFHDYAMEQWSQMNQRFKNGTLPPEVIMHAALFAQLSPNTPVPMQELMYGHLVDSMKHTGIDARDPRFAQQRQDWLNRDTPNQLPQTSPEHWDRLGDQIRVRGDQAKRAPGELMSFMLANNKFDNMAEYHNMHNQLTELVQRHKGNARAAAAELMRHKAYANLKDPAKTHEKNRQAAIAAGQPDMGAYVPGPAVDGLAPKTARYMLGMIGGGNVQVPDTHFTRYLFGLEKGRGKKLDNDTIEAIKMALWNERGSHVLDGIDRYYAKHHDAVKHMMEHPKYGKLFANPEEAIFPAFWKNWVSIVPHERLRGMFSGGVNEGTDHRVFWNNTIPLLKGEMSLPMQTAMLHHKWVQEHGEIPALMMYYAHLAPRLMAAHRARQFESTIRKAESAIIDLRKAQADHEARLDEHVQRSPVFFGGRQIVPGEAFTADGKFALLDEDKDHFVAVPEALRYTFEPEHLVRFHKSGQGTHFQVMARPAALLED